LKEKVDGPKKEIPKKDVIADAKREKILEPSENVRDQEYDGPGPEKPSRKEIEKEIDKKIVKRVITDENDEEKSERDENKEIWKEIREMKVKYVNLNVKHSNLMDDYEILKSRVIDLENELKILRRNEKEYLNEREISKRKVEALEKKWDLSHDELGMLRDNFQRQLEDFQSAGKVDEGWKGVEENIMGELKYVKSKLSKRIKKNELDKVIVNLKEEVNELKKKLEVKRSTQYSTPVKGSRRPNNSGWKKDYHSPVHSPDKDWWKKKKRKWYRPLWCGTHGWGVHTTNTCWTEKKKKMAWKVKEVKDLDKKVKGALPEEAVQEKIQ